MRPRTEQFLEQVSKCYNICAFTLGVKKYAYQVLRLLDPHKKYFQLLLHRDHNVYNQALQRPMKDLNLVVSEHIPIKDIVIVDNNFDGIV